MHFLGFPAWDVRDLISGYLSRHVAMDGNRLSPLASVLVVASVSVALWVMIAVLGMRFF
jgi:hypothetical protein